MEDIRRRGSRLVLGETGIGKSSIFASLLRQPGESVLSVGLYLHQVSATLPQQGIMAGEASLLSLELLTPCIFEAYWEKTIRSGRQRTRYLPQLRADRRWMELLRWFYRRYPPVHPAIDDYELMAWLRAPGQVEPLHAWIPPLYALRELIRLITWKVPPELFFGARELLQPYTHVQVFLDGTEQLSPPAFKRLIADAQRLYDLQPDHFEFKVFVDSAWKAQVARMEGVRQGRVNVVILSPWPEPDLRALLRRRMLSFQPGGTTRDSENMPEYDLGHRLADSGSLRPEARDGLESLIVAGAQGIPLDALRLARCVVAACAGCCPAEFKPPLGVYDIKRLIDLYQKSAGLSRKEAMDLAS